MNWNNVNLSSPYESSQDFLDGYDFDTLLLEVECNCREITPEAVRQQAIDQLKVKYETAIEILEANLANITAYAQKTRQSH